MPVAREQLLGNAEKMHAESDVAEACDDSVHLKAAVRQLETDRRDLMTKLGQLSAERQQHLITVKELTSDREKLSTELDSVKAALVTAHDRSDMSVDFFCCTLL